MAARLEDALARHRIICTTALVVLGLGAWVYLIAGAELSTVPVAGTASMRHPSGMATARMAMAGMAMTTSAAEKPLPWGRMLSGVIGAATAGWGLLLLAS